MFPNRQLVQFGDMAEFSCFSDDYPTWSYQGGILPENVWQLQLGGTEQYLLRINNVQPYHTGIYTCTGEYKKIPFEHHGELSVIGK